MTLSQGLSYCHSSLGSTGLFLGDSAIKKNIILLTHSRRLALFAEPSPVIGLLDCGQSAFVHPRRWFALLCVDDRRASLPSTFALAPSSSLVPFSFCK